MRPQTNHTPELFVTASEVARALRYTPKAIRNMFVRGDLPGEKIGGRWRMHREDFVAITTPRLFGKDAKAA